MHTEMLQCQTLHAKSNKKVHITTYTKFKQLFFLEMVIRNIKNGWYTNLVDTVSPAGGHLDPVLITELG